MAETFILIIIAFPNESVFILLEIAIIVLLSEIFEMRLLCCMFKIEVDM